LVQGLVIMLGSALLFGVRWGDPVAAALLLVAFAIRGRDGEGPGQR
jgi:ABC-2 type transport system permease protein